MRPKPKQRLGVPIRKPLMVPHPSSPRSIAAEINSAETTVAFRSNLISAFNRGGPLTSAVIKELRTQINSSNPPDKAARLRLLEDYPR